MSFACLSVCNVFADSPCDSEMPKHQHTRTMQEQNCEKPCDAPIPCPSECFLCTNKNMCTLFSQMKLSNTQICTAEKIQDKYDLETYSISDRIKCEEESLCKMEANCCKASEIRKQKRLIKKLKNEHKKICKCYEEQFQSILSNDQKKSYRKYKKCN
jgi:hypothetical protein